MAANHRRLLIITSDFPPVATSGSLRLAAFARHLPEHGWRTVAVTMRRPLHGNGEPAERALPEHGEVIRALGFDTKAVLAWRGRYPGILAFPDRAASWIADGLRQALAACRRRQIDAVLSSSPAVSAHVIGYGVKRIAGVPWVADVRDPWNLDAPYGPRLQSLDRHLERRLLAAADRITVVAHGMVAALAEQCGAGIRPKIRLVANGYDEQAMQRLTAAVDPQAPFRIVHTGVCAGPYRDPTPLLRAVRLCLDRGQVSERTEVELIGSESQAELTEQIARLGLQRQVRCRSRVSHDEALAATAGATVLLVLQTRPEHDCCIPAKTYEYLRTDRAILGAVRPQSDAANLLRRFDGVTLVPPTDIEAIAGALADLHRAWEAGRSGGFKRDAAHLSRQHAAAGLAAVLAELGASGGGSAS